MNSIVQAIIIGGSIGLVISVIMTIVVSRWNVRRIDKWLKDQYKR